MTQVLAKEIVMTRRFRFTLPVLGLLSGLLVSEVGLAAEDSTLRSAPLRRATTGSEIRPKSAPPLGGISKSSGSLLVELRASREVAQDELESLRRWNRAGNKPMRNALARSLPTPQPVRFAPSLWARDVGEHAGGRFERLRDQSLAWGTTVKVAGAYRSRLHLAEVTLPSGALLWVVGDDESVGPFGLELRDEDGGLWTPSVAGETLRLEVRLPAGTTHEPGFIIDQVLEILGGELSAAEELLPRGQEPGHCLVNSQCVNTATFDVIDLVRPAIAHIEFVDSCPPGVAGNCGYVCSGGLLNAAGDPTETIAYFLTANHCFSRQKAAASLEAFFDFFTPSCNGAAPTLGSRPRSNGSTLLVSQAATDVTLVRLNNLPPGRTFLGWTNASLVNGQSLHRVSSPCDPGFTSGCRPLPLQYSRNQVDTGAQTCQGVGRPAFLYETYVADDGDIGGTFGGSSGAPAMLDGGVVVGQLLGGCGTNPLDGCDYASNAEVDGAFRASFSALAPFIDPLPSTCVADAFTACLVGGRFKVTLDYRTSAGVPERARLSASGTDNSGLFYFTNPSNWEMLVKVLDGCPVNQHKWLFYAATTNVDFTLTVIDTQTGQSKSYANPQGLAALPVQDTVAFETCP